MLLPALLIALGCLVQVPSDQLQRELASEEADVRYAAALELAVGDGEAEKWLLRASGKGTPEVRRTLLLAAALMGTEKSFDLLEKAAHKGRKPTPERAYALVLYGALHPDAGLDPKKDWARAASDFERGCLLAGLLSQPQRLAVPAWQKLVFKRKAPGLQALYSLAAQIRGESWDETPQDVASLAARALTSHVPGVAGVQAQLFSNQERAAFPQLWAVGARHTPARKAKDLMGQALVDDQTGLVLSLYEVEPGYRQGLFDYFRVRTVGTQEAAWLWGAAGDLQLTLPPASSGKLEEAYVAGLLRLALQDFSVAIAVAQSYLPQARTLFHSKLPMERRWAAAVLMALGGQVQDKESIKASFLASSGVDRQTLQPIWKLSNRSLGATRFSWLGHWSRELGAGWKGFLDKQGPRLVAYQLVGGTVAAEGRPELATSFPGLELVPKDYAGDAVLYRDLAVFLLDGAYQWGLCSD